MDTPSRVASLLPGDLKRSRTRTLLTRVGALLLVALCVGLLLWGQDADSPLRVALRWLMEHMRDERYGVLYVLLTFSVGALLFAPITALMIGTALVVEPWLAFAYCMAGALTSSSMIYVIGRALGSRVLDRMAGSRLRRVRAEVHARSVRAVILARLLPVGNFTLVNLFLGALAVPFPAFFCGNVLGLAPGVLALTLFAKQLESAVHSPSLMNIGRLAAVLVAFLAATWGLSRWMVRRRARAALEQRAPESYIP